MKKYSRYQEYVINDGKLVGEFDDMYRDYDDPWSQTQEEFASEKAMALNAIEALKAKSVIELGCGLGVFTKKIKKLDVKKVVGVDISSNAIEKAKKSAPECEFEVGDILDFDIYRKHRPDIIVMAEITWYVLEKLEKFKTFLKEEFPQTYLIHLLNTYPAGEQKYGREYFVDLKGILDFYGMNYLEYGQVHKASRGGCDRTYFIGRFGELEKTQL